MHLAYNPCTFSTYGVHDLVYYCGHQIYIHLITECNCETEQDITQCLLCIKNILIVTLTQLGIRFYMTNTCLCPYYTIKPNMKVRSKTNSTYESHHILNIFTLYTNQLTFAGPAWHQIQRQNMNVQNVYQTDQ